MESFLQECRPNLKNCNKDTKIQIVLGNEACDLDSAVSALVTAYFLSKIQKATDVVIPVLNVKRKTLPLRTEVTFFLEETSIPIDALICVDEIDLKSLSENENVSIVLVDHNTLSIEQSCLESRIVQIIDHHAVDNPEKISRCKTKIELVGSCCTLVAEEIFVVNDSIMDPQIAMLLYGTILLDTICLQESAKRVTEKDKVMASRLEGYLEGVNREEVFETLQRVKFDVSKLSPELLLQKDVKFISWESTNIAIAALPILLQNVVESETFLSALNQFASENKLKSVILMGYKLTGDNSSMKRQLGIFDNSADSLEKITNYLLSLENPSLGLQPLPFSGKSIALFDQDNISLTRKFVLPALQNYLKCNSGRPKNFNAEFKCENINSILNGFQERNSLMVSDDSLPLYQVETLDVPESPTHSSKLLGITVELEKLKSDGEILDPGEINLEELPEMNNSERVSTLKRIAVSPMMVLKPDGVHIEDDQRSLSSLSNKSDLDVLSPTDDIIIPDDVDTLEEFENSDCIESYESDPIPEMSAAEEYEEERSWKSCMVNGELRRIDMKVIEPYRKVLSHGGYQEHNAIIIFSACYLPDRSRRDYNYVMDNLFLYVITSLDELVAEDYVLVYLHGATERSTMPGFAWLKQCYQMIDRRLRKNLKGLYLVHPTFWLKTIVIMTRPFISSKFSRKLKFVSSLKELSSLIPLDQVCIPDKVKQVELERMLKTYLKYMKSGKFSSAPEDLTLESLNRTFCSGSEHPSIGSLYSIFDKQFSI